MAFPKGEAFPIEAFVQQAIERHFVTLGFKPEPAGYIDYVCVYPETGERWVIEAKGKTLDIGLDFRTCLGQVVQRMDDPSDGSTRYAVAMPDLPQYQAQCQQVKTAVRMLLNLHWLFVDEDGTVQTVTPDRSDV
jgi:hypothetical protein